MKATITYKLSTAGQKAALLAGQPGTRERKDEIKMKTLYAVWNTAASDIWFAALDRDAAWTKASNWVENESGWDNTDINDEEWDEGDVEIFNDSFIRNGQPVYTGAGVSFAHETI